MCVEGKDCAFGDRPGCLWTYALHVSNLLWCWVVGEGLDVLAIAPIVALELAASDVREDLNAVRGGGEAGRRR